MRVLYQAMSRSARTNKGFTLIELLVVVGIIAILAAIAIPQFSRYRRQAAASAIMSDAKNCLTDAMAQITQAQMLGQTPPTSGSYANRSPYTASCSWTLTSQGNNAVLRCTCNGAQTYSAISCFAEQPEGGQSVARCQGV